MGGDSKYADFARRTGREQIVIDAALDRQVEGYQALAAHAQKEGWPQGLFCQNDELALGAYRALREAGLRAGREVAVIGCDDTGGEFFDPPLTSIALPFPEICEMAWSLLMERIESPDLPSRSRRVVPRLIERSSSFLMDRTHA